MAVTSASLRLRVKRLVYSSRPALRPYQDKVLNAAGLLIGGTTLDVTDGTSWVTGDIVEFDDGEQALVTSVAANVLTIQRAQFGTVAAAHLINTEIVKNPRFGVHEIDDAIETVLYDLYPQIYTIQTDATNTVIAGQNWYPIVDDGVFEILNIYYADPSYEAPYPISGWDFRKVLTSGFVQDQGLYLSGFSGARNGDTMYITWKRKISAVADLLDRQEPMVAMGTTYHLLGGENISRTHDPGQRTDRTVQPGQDGRDSIWFLREYRSMLTREEIRLKADEQGLVRHRIDARRQRWVV